MKKKIFKYLYTEISPAKRGGYTIIETMIAISLFLVVAVSGMGAVLNANLLHLKSQDIRSIMDNFSFIMEDISRTLRNGYDYQCFAAGQSLAPGTLGAPRSCASGWALALETGEGNPNTFTDQWVYYISTEGKIMRSTDGASSFIQLSPNEVVVASVSGFSVLGAESPSLNTQQPFVTIRLSGTITTRGVITPFTLQTSVSQRMVDI